MGLVEWKNEYSVGIKSIDDQHKKWIVILNNLHDSLKQGKGRDQLAKTFKELVEYTEYHFKYEEQLFQKTGYPASTEHLALHKKMVGKVQDLKQRFDQNNLMITTEVMDFLRDWLIHHIMDSDKKYSEHLKKAGVS